jgi:hypothetical protein
MFAGGIHHWECAGAPRVASRTRLCLGELGDQGLDSFLEEVDEFGVHEGEVVGDVEDFDVEVGKDVGEAVGEAAFLIGLHDEDEVGPEQESLGDTTAGGGAEASALDFDSGGVLIERLGRGAAPLIARAEEEELEHVGMKVTQAQNL